MTDMFQPDGQIEEIMYLIVEMKVLSNTGCLYVDKVVYEGHSLGTLPQTPHFFQCL